MMFFKNKKLEEAERKIVVLEAEIAGYIRAIEEVNRYITRLAYENYELKKNVKKSKKRT